MFILKKLLNKKTQFYSFFYKVTQDISLSILDKFNDGKFEHYLLDPVVFSKYVENKFKGIMPYFDQNVMEDFNKFFSHKLCEKITLINIYDGIYKRKSFLLSFKDFNKFLDFIYKSFDKIISSADHDINKLMNRLVKITFFNLPPFEITGSVYQYFSNFTESFIEIKASFGVIHSPNNTFDFYVVDPKTKKIVNENITKQKSMKIITNNTLVDFDLPYEWQRHPRLKKEIIDQVILLYFQAKLEIKKPFELYFGIIGKKVYIYDINFEYDGVSDYIDYQIEGSGYNNIFKEIHQNVLLDIKEDIKSNSNNQNIVKSPIKKLNTKL